MQTQITEGERIDAIKAHLKKHKRKYLLGGAIAAGLGSLEAYGASKQNSELKNYAKVRDSVDRMVQNPERGKKYRASSKDQQDQMDKVVSDAYANANSHMDKAIAAERLRPSTYFR